MSTNSPDAVRSADASGDESPDTEPTTSGVDMVDQQTAGVVPDFEGHSASPYADAQAMLRPILDAIRSLTGEPGDDGPAAEGVPASGQGPVSAT